MTGRKSGDREELDQLVDFLVEDALTVSDEEILAEARDEGIEPESDAARLRALFERTVLNVNKRRLLAAKAAVQADKSASGGRGTVFDIQEARRRLQLLLEQRSSGLPVTMAARKESELSDADVMSMVQDLEELGLLPSDKP
jgi:hypothetical protein